MIRPFWRSAGGRTRAQTGHGRLHSERHTSSGAPSCRGSKTNLSPPLGKSPRVFSQPPGDTSHQVGEVVAILARHEPAGVAESSDILDIGLQSRGVALQDDVDKGGQEVIGRGWLILGDLDGIEDVLAAPGDAGQLVPRHTL